MSAYKDEKKGTWYAYFRFTDWKGERKQKLKRGFATKREALNWEQVFLQQKSSDMDMIRSIVAQYLRLKGKTDDLEIQLSSAYDRLSTLNSSFDRMAQETLTLRRTLVDYKRIRQALGEQQTDRLLEQAKAKERTRKQNVHQRNYER